MAVMILAQEFSFDVNDLLSDIKWFVSVIVVTDNGVKYFQWLYGDSIDDPIPLDEWDDEPVLAGAEFLKFSLLSFVCCWEFGLIKGREESFDECVQ